MKERFYKTNKQLIEHCVDTFLAVSKSALHQASGDVVGLDGLSDEKAEQDGRLAWVALQRARLFCFEPERWKSLHDAAERYVMTSLAGLDPPARSQVRLRAVDVLESEDAPMTRAGWENLRSPKMTVEQQNGFEQMLEIYDAACAQGALDVAAMAGAQMLDAVSYLSDEDFAKLISAHEDYGVRWPFPERLPFDSCFFSFSPKCNLTYSPKALHTRIRASELQILGAKKVFLLGYLVVWEGDTSSAFTALGFDIDKDDEGRIPPIGLVKTYEDGEWLQPMSMDPWIVTMLVKAINDHKQIVEAHPVSLSTRLARKRASKRETELLPLPAPYYLVNLKDEFIAAPKKANKTSSNRSVEWSHRWDVRGHECVRVERGQMPASFRDVEKLKKRGYRIYEGTSLLVDDAGRLLKRGVRAPGPSEWIAVLSYWRESFVKGPEEKPYVPAARVEAS
jgi:hypothetical protein